jgi:hypothetical protein
VVPGLFDGWFDFLDFVGHGEIKVNWLKGKRSGVQAVAEFCFEMFAFCIVQGLALGVGDQENVFDSLAKGCHAGIEQAQAAGYQGLGDG